MFKHSLHFSYKKLAIFPSIVNVHGKISCDVIGSGKNLTGYMIIQESYMIIQGSFKNLRSHSRIMIIPESYMIIQESYMIIQKKYMIIQESS